MGTVAGTLIVGLLLYGTYGRYCRVLARKRYSTRQTGAPDLRRFAEGPGASDGRAEDPRPDD
jgi:hypothetical protein